jgi:hypothetical protein
LHSYSQQVRLSERTPWRKTKTESDSLYRNHRLFCLGRGRLSLFIGSSSRPRKCSGTRIGTFECAILPGKTGRGAVEVGAAGDLAPPGNGPRGGFLAGSRKALSRARASSSVIAWRSQRFSGAKSMGTSHGSTKTGSAKFGRRVTAAHCPAPRSKLE